MRSMQAHHSYSLRRNQKGRGRAFACICRSARRTNKFWDRFEFFFFPFVVYYRGRTEKEKKKIRNGVPKLKNPPVIGCYRRMEQTVDLIQRIKAMKGKCSTEGLVQSMKTDVATPIPTHFEREKNDNETFFRKKEKSHSASLVLT